MSMSLAPFLRESLKKSKGEGLIRVQSDSGFLVELPVPLTQTGLRQVSDEVDRCIEENYRGSKQPRVYSVTLLVESAPVLATSITRHPSAATTVDDVLSAAHTALVRMTDTTDKAMGNAHDRVLAVANLMEGLLTKLTGEHAREREAANKTIENLTGKVYQLSEERIQYAEVVAKGRLDTKLQEAAIAREGAIIDVIRDVGSVGKQFLPLVIRWAIKGKLSPEDLKQAAKAGEGKSQETSFGELKKIAKKLTDQEIKALLTAAVSLDTEGKLLDCLQPENGAALGALLVSYAATL